eukprot:GHVO01031017.1.p3 GENE.GHVO01031017.1~~GHVO01031017.1.p3  ORF type:complete len:170 (+),score=39.98 GHVO01031017.1:620-1129(+)
MDADSAAVGGAHYDLQQTDAAAPTAWRAVMQCFTAGAIQVRTPEQVVLHSNGVAVVEGEPRTVLKEKAYMVASEDGLVERGVEVVPSRIGKEERRPKITLCNLSSQTVVIPAGTVICRAEVVDDAVMPEDDETGTGADAVMFDDISSRQKEEIQEMLGEASYQVDEGAI